MGAAYDMTDLHYNITLLHNSAVSHGSLLYSNNGVADQPHFLNGAFDVCCPDSIIPILVE